MTMTYYKDELERVAREHGFIRDTFEKVVRLKEILMFINQHDFLSKHLLLKGGTAINLTIFDLPRLSVDIDMDYTPNDSKDDMHMAREDIGDTIKAYMQRNGYQLSEKSRISYSLDAFYFAFVNAGGNRDLIKIEINYSLRAHIFDPNKRAVLPQLFGDVKNINTLNPMEVFASKGNALLDRAAARDLYDWCGMIDNQLFDEATCMFRKCFIFYASISRENIGHIFDTSRIDRIDYRKVRMELLPVINKNENFNVEERKDQAKLRVGELSLITQNEQEYLERFAYKEYRPDLLFDDEEIVSRIENHPMAHWKCR